MPTLSLHNIAQIKNAEIKLGDLTVLVGPQATGKSIALQFLKLLIDTGYVQHELQRYGLDWSRDISAFLDVYFGEGMRSIWRSGKSAVTWSGKEVSLETIVQRRRKFVPEELFFIPAQRVLTLREGWPRPFTDYAPGDPFTVREFSEKLRVLMEQEFQTEGSLFPQERRLKSALRELLQENVFSNFELRVEKARSQKRLMLGTAKNALPYMVWSAGQREFVPLLLGFYWLMPPTKVARRDDFKWVVIEEPEMGLHPRAISVVLLLILELLKRDYKVCVSTHSPQVLELVWALKRISQEGGGTSNVLNLFNASGKGGLRRVAERALEKKIKVFYFERESGNVHDISSLDPFAEHGAEASWGGLSEFSERVNAEVARVAANAK